MRLKATIVMEVDPDEFRTNEVSDVVRDYLEDLMMEISGIERFKIVVKEIDN